MKNGVFVHTAYSREIEKGEDKKSKRGGWQKEVCRDVRLAITWTFSIEKSFGFSFLVVILSLYYHDEFGEFLA